MRWKYISRAKSHPPGRSGWSGGDKCALNSTKLPTAGALPLRTATRTRSGGALTTPAVSKGCMRTEERARSEQRGRNRALQEPEGHCGQRDRAPARQKGQDRRYQSQSESSSPGGFPVGGEVDDNAETESDGQPRHQASGHYFRRGPARDRLT